MSDLEDDSTMHSSPSANDDDEMFPDEALSTHDPATTTNLSSSVLQFHPQLSPSKPQPQPRDSSTLTTGVNANGKRPLSAAQPAAAAGPDNTTHHDPETGYKWSRSEDQPGFEWKNNRAREEEARALDIIIDLGMQIKVKYGDPLDSSVGVKGKR